MGRQRQHEIELGDSRVVAGLRGPDILMTRPHPWYPHQTHAIAFPRSEAHRLAQWLIGHAAPGPDERDVSFLDRLRAAHEEGGIDLTGGLSAEDAVDGVRGGESRGGIAAIKGRWPGDETDAEIGEAMRRMHDREATCG